jgi:hypothetical protein
MNSITVVVAPEPTRVRMLVRRCGRDVLKAVLGPARTAHPRAVATLLEGLALWHQQRLGVVLCVDDPFDGCALGLCDALGFGKRSVHYEVGIAQLSAYHRTLAGIGDFSDLRRLDLAEVLP